MGQSLRALEQVVSMKEPGTHVGDLCRELEITRQTFYRHVGPDGTLREDGRKLLEHKTTHNPANPKE